MLPLLEYPAHRALGIARHQPQRIAVEIDGVRWDGKALAERGQLVGLVEVERLLFADHGNSAELEASS